MSSESTQAREPQEGRRLLYCHCAYSRVVPKDVKAEVLKALAESGQAFDAVPDLCELAARHDPALEKLADPGQGEVDIVACYPRAVRWLFHAADSPLPETGVHIHNMRTDDAESILVQLGVRAGSQDTHKNEPAALPKEDAGLSEEASP